jgi:hypothetical protein
MIPGRKEALDEFGKAAVHEVYDRAIEFLQDTMAHGMKGIKPDPLHIAYRNLDAHSAEVLRRFLIEAVDQTFAQFLHFFDVHAIPIRFQTTSGEEVDVRALSDGLAAEPYRLRAGERARGLLMQVMLDLPDAPIFMKLW